MATFPSIEDLANAQEEKVLRLWQGLGYYSRARNLHATSKYISENLNGVFPNTYSEIIKLKGIGPYTAAAIASICFGEATPVVDGNVFRFASRYFGIDADISASGSRKVFERILQEHIHREMPGTFNQAMMEFGATVCAPSPDCKSCIFSLECFAFRLDKQRAFPVKTKKTKVSGRSFSYVVFRSEETFLLRERKMKDVWSGLYDFYLLEGNYDQEDILSHIKDLVGSSDFSLNGIVGEIKHVLSHQIISSHFYEIEVSYEDLDKIAQNNELAPFSVKEMLNLPKPKLIVNYLEQLGIN